MAKFHKSTTLNFFLMFLIFSSIITLTNQKKHLRKRKSLRKLQATTQITIPTSSATVTSTIPKTSLTSTNVIQTIPTTIIQSSTDASDDLNSTYIYKPSSDSGLSTGAIVGILIPSLLAVGGVGAYAAIARGSRPPIQYNNTSYTNGRTNIPIDSRQNIREVQVNQPEIVLQNPAVPIGKEVPGVINQPIPNNQVIISQSQFIPNNNEVKTFNV